MLCSAVSFSSLEIFPYISTHYDKKDNNPQNVGANHYLVINLHK